ncbi:MAG: hypothetical protein IJW70_03475 [Clostridia bacterium]|nr:hypothetical protein [Clostridia bacterium]
MKRIAIVLLVLWLVLVGCGEQRIRVENGETLDRDEQESLYDQRAEQQSEPDISGKGVVYWTQSGTKYHKDPTCSFLKNAKELLSGTIAQAANHGADSPCSRCSGG